MKVLLTSYLHVLWRNVWVPVHFVFSLPLIFIMVAGSISHFLTAAMQFPCFSSNENGLRCYLFHALALSLLSKYKNLVERKTRFFLSLKSGRGHVVYRRNERRSWNAKFHLSYNILLTRRADFWLSSPSPSVCTDGRLYADVITKFSRMDRFTKFS